MIFEPGRSFLLFAFLAIITVPPNSLASEPAGPADEPPLDATAAPQSPEQLHPSEKRGVAASVEPVLVDFATAVALTAAEDREDPHVVRFHIQGEPAPEQAGGDGGGTSTPRQPPPPEIGPPLLDIPSSNAPGDLATGFAGINYTGWIPPDTVAAVGPSHVVEAVNSGFAVYSKSGGLLKGYTTFDSFLSFAVPANWSGFLFDPRIVYSAQHSRYVMLVLGLDSTHQDSFQFVLTASDPTGSWSVYRWPVDAANSADSDAWMDYCGLGVDAWGIYTTCNLFTWTNSFKYGQLWAFDTAMLLGQTAGGTVFWDLRWNSGTRAFSLQPASPYSNAADEATFFVNTLFLSGDDVLLWQLVGDRADSPTLSRTTIAIDPYDAIGENVDQPGSSNDLDGGDARIMNAAYKSRSVYGVLTTDVSNVGANAGWYVFRLDVDTKSLTWDTTVWTSSAGPGGFYYFYPAITLDGSGGGDPNLAVFGSWTDSETATTASTNFVSGLYKVFSDQPTSTSGSFISFVSGDDDYTRRDSGGRNRWGDYSGAGYDWGTGNAWGAVTAASTLNRWKTHLQAVDIQDGSSCSGDGFEEDDSTSQAKAISSGVDQSRNICPSGDPDWAFFTLSETSGVTLETSGPSGDTDLTLYDGGLPQIEYDDDGGASLFSYIDRVCGTDPLPAGTYYVRVGEFGNDDEIPSYTLSYDKVACSSSCSTDLTLSNTTITGTETYRASNGITLGPSLVVDGTDIRMVGGQRIVIEDGTRIGGRFSAEISDNPCTAVGDP